MTDIVGVRDQNGTRLGFYGYIDGKGVYVEGDQSIREENPMQDYAPLHGEHFRQMVVDDCKEQFE
jgi:hypothetical protein